MDVTSSKQLPRPLCAFHSMQGAQSMVVHKSRLELEKEAAVAAAKARSTAAGKGPVPSYMRATSAFASKLQPKARPSCEP